MKDVSENARLTGRTVDYKLTSVLGFIRHASVSSKNKIIKTLPQNQWDDVSVLKNPVPLARESHLAAVF